MISSPHSQGPFELRLASIISRVENKSLDVVYVNVKGRNYLVRNLPDKEEAANLMVENSSYPCYFFKTDTSGEKLYEEFYTNDDQVNLNKFESIGVVTNSKKPSYSEIHSVINDLISLFDREGYKKDDIIKSMNNLLPNFKHIETGKSLDQKM